MRNRIREQRTQREMSQAETGKEPGQPGGDVSEVTLAADGDQTILILDQPGLPGRVGQPAAQNRYLLFEERDLRGEAFDLVVMPRGKRAVITSGHAPTSFRKQVPPRPYLSAALS